MKRRLLWRVYLHGILLLVLVALFMVVFHWASGKPPWSGASARVAEMLRGDFDQPARLQARVDDLAFLLDCELGVFGADGSAVAVSSADLVGLSQEQRVELTAEGHLHDRQLVASALDESGTHVLARWRWDHRGRRFLLALLGLLLVLALGSVPLARGLVRPLERLTETARRLGEGDLDARANLPRKDEIGQLAGAMDEMAERLQRALRNERELLANVGHELRTPLARIRVALAIAEEDGVDLQGLPIDLAELESLVEDVLAAGRLERAGELPLSLREVDWAEFTERTRARFQTRHPGIPLSLVCTAAPSVADATLVTRLVDNLLSNAVRHGAGAEIRLKFETQESLVVSVSDRGPGVPEDVLPRIFDPFQRADSARTGTGVGLGLTLCRRIVEAHGGEIAAHSREPTGLAVTARLPLAVPDRDNTRSLG